MLRNPGMIAAIITLAVGFVPFAVLSLLSGTFWPHSKVAVPLFLVPSVLIGDSILLPLFNRRAVPLLINFLRCTLPSSRISPWLFALGALLASTCINAWLHFRWKADDYTGFIDPSPGQLSVAGKWHLVFSILQMTLVLWFLFLAFVAWKESGRTVHAEVARAWSIFMAYSALSIADFAVMHLVIAPGRPFSITDLVALAPFPLTVIVYALLR